MPEKIPLVFSLSVIDNYKLKSLKDDYAQTEVICSDSDQRKAENASLFFKKLINFPKGSYFYPQTVDNFAYFISGKGDVLPTTDTHGNFLGVSGLGTPKPLPILWLESADEFLNAQVDMASRVDKDIQDLLNKMKKGEIHHLEKDYSYNIDDSRKIYIWTPMGHVPSDFTTAVGAANAHAHFSLDIKKGPYVDSLSGSVKLDLKDIYDFNPNRQSFVVGHVGSVNLDEIYSMIKCLGARNFDQTTSYTKSIDFMLTSKFKDYFPTCIKFFSCKVIK